MTAFHSTFQTPLGAFSIAVDDDGSLLATAFGDGTALQRRFPAQSLSPDTGQKTARVREQIEAYFTGARRSFSVPLAARGTAFQQRVWSALQEIPFGKTCTYAELAAQLGNAKASRAVGRANATNPICLIVPCHRVIGADGSLTGFAFGEKIKQQLLDHERAHALHSRAA